MIANHNGCPSIQAFTKANNPDPTKNLTKYNTKEMKQPLESLWSYIQIKEGEENDDRFKLFLKFIPERLSDW